MPSILSSLRNSFTASNLSVHDSQPVDHKITLRDNTITPERPERVSSTVNSTALSTPTASVYDGRPGSRGSGNERSGGALRKAMARRKYSRWSAGAIDISGVGSSQLPGQAGPEPMVASEDELPGVVVSRGNSKKNGKSTKMTAEEKLRSLESKNNGTEVLEILDDNNTVRQNGEPRESSLSLSQRDNIADNGSVTLPTDLRKIAKDKPRKARRAEIDILYENQRGMFLCGIPFFSSKSLLNFDPPAWQTRDFKPSPVSILDKQTPDPSWEWAWKTWYVDMTSDVDDQGWTYSFSFNPYFSWHGNHVWFHSYARRRRWLRKRVKILPTGDLPSPAGEEGHRLNPDYFTIHSNKPRSRHESSTQSWRNPRQSQSVGGAGWGSGWDHYDEEGLGGLGKDEEITDVPTLMRVLRRCTLDREKIIAMDRFVKEGGEEVWYLAERMPQLMSLLVFQASRRQFLAHLNAAYYQAEAEFSQKYSKTASPSDTPHSDSPNSSSPSAPSEVPPSPSQISPTHTSLPLPPLLSPIHEDSSDAAAARARALRRLEALKQAVKAADEEVKRLEFWSDIKDVVRSGHSSGARAEWEGPGETDGEGKWVGVDASGPDVMKVNIVNRDSDGKQGGGGGRAGKGKGKGKDDVKGKGKA